MNKTLKQKNQKRKGQPSEKALFIKENVHKGEHYCLITCPEIVIEIVSVTFGIKFRKNEIFVHAWDVEDLEEHDYNDSFLDYWKKVEV